MLLTAAVALLCLAGATLPVVAVLASALAERTRARRVLVRHAVVTLAIALAGVGAAVLASQLPPTLIGLVGLFPLLRGLRRVAGRSLVPDVAGAVEPAGLAAAATDGVVAYLALVVTRAAPEILVTVTALLVVALAAVLAARALVGRPRLRHADVVAGWTQVALGSYLLIDGGALSMLRPF